jgi:hypothetical protein
MITKELAMRSSGSFFAVWQSHRKKVKLQLQRQLIASLRTGGGGEEEEEDIVMDVEQVQNLLEQLGDSAHCTALESALWLGWLPRLSAVWCGVCRAGVDTDAVPFTVAEVQQAMLQIGQAITHTEAIDSPSYILRVRSTTSR